LALLVQQRAPQGDRADLAVRGPQLRGGVGGAHVDHPRDDAAHRGDRDRGGRDGRSGRRRRGGRHRRGGGGPGGRRGGGGAGGAAGATRCQLGNRSNASELVIRVRSLPLAAFMVYSSKLPSRVEVNAMRVPSGDQAAVPSVLALLVSRLTFEPSAFIE